MSALPSLKFFSLALVLISPTATILQLGKYDLPNDMIESVGTRQWSKTVYVYVAGGNVSPFLTLHVTLCVNTSTPAFITIFSFVLV